jgi:hypothetical protein
MGRLSACTRSYIRRIISERFLVWARSWVRRSWLSSTVLIDSEARESCVGSPAYSLDETSPAARTAPSQRIVKGGNDRLKRDLMLAADTARKFDPELARVYFSMMVNKGKHHRQALCAVATRLTNRIHTVLKGGRPYVLRDLEGKPITIAEGKAIVDLQFHVPLAVPRVSRRGRQLAAEA